MTMRAAVCSGLLITALLAACAEEQGYSGTSVLRFTDDLGRTVALNGPAERVITLAPNLTEIVYAAGGGEKLVGVTSADDYPPSVDTLPRLSALPVDFEKVLLLEPDIVLATDQVNSPRDAGTFESLRIPLYFFRFTSLDDVIAGVRKAGEIMGTSHAANAAADSLEAGIESLRTRTKDVARPRVLVLIGDETLNAFGAESYVHDLVELAGGHSLTEDLGANPVLSEEFVLKAAPEVIVGIWGESYDVNQLLTYHPAWEAVPAVQQGKVYSLSGDLISRPGPRLVEGAQRLACILHPELFASDRLSQERVEPDADIAADSL